jgi:crotonobetainyl-CoA:carnitine CoA-transferase CaiB-like acyl-CoA transferase
MGFARQLSAPHKPHRMCDGWACILPYSDRNWQDCFAFVGQPPWLDGPRFADVAQRVVHVDALYAIVKACAAKRGTGNGGISCDGVGIPCMPVLALEQLREDAHVQAVGLMEAAKHPSDGRYRAPCARVGRQR